MTSTLMKMLVTTGSAASIGFGAWHFFVPLIAEARAILRDR
jgi:hypothetical protein